MLVIQNKLYCELEWIGLENWESTTKRRYWVPLINTRNQVEFSVFYPHNFGILPCRLLPYIFCNKAKKKKTLAKFFEVFIFLAQERNSEAADGLN